MPKRGGGGDNRLDHQYYTRLYQKGIKKTENKSMETTNLVNGVNQKMELFLSLKKFFIQGLFLLHKTKNILNQYKQE